MPVSWLAEALSWLSQGMDAPQAAGRGPALGGWGQACMRVLLLPGRAPGATRQLVVAEAQLEVGRLVWRLAGQLDAQVPLVAQAGPPRLGQGAREAVARQVQVEDARQVQVSRQRPCAAGGEACLLGRVLQLLQPRLTARTSSAAAPRGSSRLLAPALRSRTA